MAYLNGQSGKITIATTDFDVESWSLNISTEALDTTNTGSSGWAAVLAGIASAEGSCKGFWDAASQPTNSGGLNARAGVVATFKLYVGASTKFFTFSALITQITIENPAKGVVPFSCSFKANGSVTYPLT